MSKEKLLDKKDIDYIIPTKRKAEAEEVLQFVQELQPDEQKELLAFLSGVRFAKRLV